MAVFSTPTIRAPPAGSSEIFSTVQYMMLASRERFSEDDSGSDAETMNEILRQLEAFFRCAARHKLLIYFF